MYQSFLILNNTFPTDRTMQSLFRSADLSLGRLFFVRDSEVAEQLLRGWIHPDQAEAGSVNPDLLCPSESFHHLAVGVVLQYLFLLRIVEYAIREQRGKKTHEFTSVDRIVAVDPGLVEFAGLLVIPHHRLDLPTPGIGIIDFLCPCRCRIPVRLSRISSASF